MNNLAVLLAVIGLTITLSTNIIYVRTIPRGKVPKKVNGYVTAFTIGIILSLIGLCFAVITDVKFEAITFATSVPGILFALPFLFLFSQPQAPLGDLKVSVGDKFFPFTAKRHDGTAFDSEELKNKRVLFKFYRGGWCPYCSAELMAFNEMYEELEKLGVTIYALSKDTPDEAAVHRDRDNLSFTLLSDTNLDVIRSYGVEHHKALGITKNPTTKIGGIPLGLGSVAYQTMAIPTTLLIDENGTICWVDQSEDYRIRSSTQRVMEAVRNAFG